MKISGLTLLTATLMTAAAAWGDISVVVSTRNEAKLDRDLIKNIFLGKKEEFPGGSVAKPVDQAEDRPIRSEFYSKLAGKDESEMKVYWSNLIFTGYGRLPKVVGDDDDVKKFIRENPDAIGYIDRKSIDASVKEVYVVK